MKVTEHRDASDRYTVEISDMPVWKYRWVKWKLRKKFRLNAVGDVTVSLDERFQGFESSRGRISIDWDIWGGFMVTSLDIESDDLVMEIKNYLKYKYEN